MSAAPAAGTAIQGLLIRPSLLNSPSTARIAAGAAVFQSQAVKRARIFFKAEKPPGVKVESQYSIKEELLEMFHRSIHLLHRSGPHFRRQVKRTPMPPAQGRLMRLLAERGATTQRSLGEMLDMRSASVSELLAKLEKPGWIRRSTNENDRRTIDINLTQEGENMLKSIGNERAEMADEVFSTLTEEELRQLHSLLGKLIGDWEGRFEDEEGCSRRGRRAHGEGRPDHGSGLFRKMREHFHHHRHHHGPHGNHEHHGHHGPHDHHEHGPHGHHDHHGGEGPTGDHEGCRPSGCRFRSGHREEFDPSQRPADFQAGSDHLDHRREEAGPENSPAAGSKNSNGD